VKNNQNQKMTENAFCQKCFKNDRKWIKTMGYSPCFLAKNDPKWMFFAPAKIIENNLKGVKMPENLSKMPKMDVFCTS
jgi:hypothetical protein